MSVNNKIFIFLVLIMSLFFSACVKEKTVVKPIPVPVVEVVQTPVEVPEIKEPEIELTPLEMCEKEEDKYNLIVNAPENSKIRILNIKPKYKKCIALKKGKYYIEVTRKGYMKHKEWINLNNDMEYDVALIELLKQDKTSKVKKSQTLEKIGFNLKKLNRFIDECQSEELIQKAQQRVDLIKKDFANYSPKNQIGTKDCIGFYPKNLVEKMLKISVPLNYWDSIRWSGSCENNMMDSRGVIYFISKKGLHVDLKGKMKNGFFEGRVYNFSRFKAKPEYIRESGRGYYHIKLKTNEDFREYEQ